MKGRTIILFIIVHAFNSLLVFAQSTENKITLQLVTEDFPPFQLVENNQITGTATKLVKAALALTPYQYSIKMYPWAQAYHIALNKENTCIYGIARTQHRENLFQWTGTTSVNETYFIGLASDKNIRVNSIDDAKKYNTAVLRDDFTHQLLLQHGFIENKNLFVANNPKALLKLLLAGQHIDLIVLDKLPLIYRANAAGIDLSQFTYHSPLQQKPVEFYLACSKLTAKTIITDITKAINTVKANANSDNITNKVLAGTRQEQASELLIVTDHYPPFQMKKNGKIIGTSTEIIRAALALTPYRYSINIYPWTQAYNIALKKINTCIYAIARTREREPLFQWTTPFSNSETRFIGLTEDTKIQINSIEDAKQYRTAVLKDDFTHPLLLNLGFIENKNFFVVNHSSSILKLLLARKHIDLILTDLITLNYRAQIEKVNFNLFKQHIALTKAPTEFYLACNLKTSTEIINNITQAINIIKKDGTLTKILGQWQDHDISQ